MFNWRLTFIGAAADPRLKVDDVYGGKPRCFNGDNSNCLAFLFQLSHRFASHIVTCLYMHYIYIIIYICTDNVIYIYVCIHVDLFSASRGQHLCRDCQLSRSLKKVVKHRGHLMGTAEGPSKASWQLGTSGWSLIWCCSAMRIWAKTS